MAKKDLDKLSKSIDKIIDEAKKGSRNLLNRQTHIYNVSSDTFATELTRQLVNIRKYSPLTDSQYKDEINRLSKEYTNNLHSSLSKIDKIDITSDTDNFRARLANIHHPNPFRAFQAARFGPVEKLKRDVIDSLFEKFTSEKEYIDYSKLSDKDLRRIQLDVKNKQKKVLATPGSNLERYEVLSSRILGSTRSLSNSGPLERYEDGSVVRSRGLTDLGHVKTLAVNKLALPVIANEIIEGTIKKQITVLGVRYSIGSAVREASKGIVRAKEFTVEVEVYDESSSQNRGDGTVERKDLNETTNAIKDRIFKELLKNDWANQESSPSFMRLVRSSILSSVSKTKGPNITVEIDKSLILPIKGGSNPLYKNRKGSNSSTIVAGGKKAKSIPKVSAVLPRQGTSQQPINWLQLLPLINAKLTPQVMKNMGSPRLNNRTGRLAQSAQVVNVEQTPQGFPSFVFDYERDPYDVFDRTLGRAPWNTPQRDPRTLVDQSVREIVREMAIGRFFTRRA